MFSTKAETLLELVNEPACGNVSVPPSALKVLRGTRRQEEVARAAGISQPYISELETGAKPLTPRMAQRLAPVLGCSASELETAERIASLKRMADGGRLDPEPLFRAIKALNDELPEDETGDALIDALLQVLGKALETHKRRGTAGVATKSKRRSRRDARGRRIDKPYSIDKHGEEENTGLRRDSQGRRLNKPFARKDGR
jgi:transcriptional regulator with XRE-family HTH domain